MLGLDKSRGYYLEMICADFLAGAQLENGNPKVLLCSMLCLFRFLPRAEKQEFLMQVMDRREVAPNENRAGAIASRCLPATRAASSPTRQLGALNYGQWQTPEAPSRQLG